MKREKLIRARLKKGLSQKAAAELMGVSRNAWNLWELGKEDPYPVNVGELCKFFGVKDPGDLDLEPRKLRAQQAQESTASHTLAALSPSQASMQVGEGNDTSHPAPKSIQGRLEVTHQRENQVLESDKTVDRREAVKTIGSLGLNLFMAPNALLKTQLLEQHSILADLSGFDETTPEALQHFASMTETCRHLSEGNELQIAERVLWTYLPRVKAIAALAFEQQQQAAAIASQGYLLAASLAGHRNDLLERLRLSEQALLYGKLARDRNLQVVALRQIAISFDYLGYPDKALSIYQRAYRHLNGVSPLLRSCIYADMSGSYAQRQQKPEAERFLNMAYEHFPQKIENEPGYLSTICRYSTLIFCEGLTYLEFGQPHLAEQVFSKIDGIHPLIQMPERVRIELLNYQIEAFTALCNMEAACHYLEAAVQAAVAIGSERRIQESLTIYQHMSTIWHNELRVQQLQELFRR